MAATAAGLDNYGISSMGAFPSPPFTRCGSVSRDDIFTRNVRPFDEGQLPLRLSLTRNNIVKYLMASFAFIIRRG